MHRVWGHASTGSKASGLGVKAHWSWRMFIKQLQNSNVSKHSLWSSSPNSELRIILQQHIDHHQMLSTDYKRQQSTNDCRRLIILSVQLCAEHDGDWVSHGLLVSTKTCFISCQTVVTNIKNRSLLMFCSCHYNWRCVTLVVVLWHPALSASSSASVTALRWEPVNVCV